MRITFILIMVFLLYVGLLSENSRERFKENYTTICVDSVEYLHYQQLYRGSLAPHFKPDGTLYTCEVENND